MPYTQTHDRPRLFYTDCGAGRPMVFVASAWLDSRMWEFQIPYLVGHGFRCVAVDRRGHGRSDSQFFLTGFTTDLRDELQSVSVLALIVHGDHDLQAPLELCGRKTAQLVPNSTLRVYENAAHGLFVTHADRLNADLLAFVGAHRSRAPATAGA